MSYVVQAVEEEFRDVFVVEGVINLAPGLTRAHDAQLPQRPQLVGDRRLGHLECCRQVADALFLLSERRDESQAGRIAERFEELGQPGGGGVIEMMDSGGWNS